MRAQLLKRLAALVVALAGMGVGAGGPVFAQIGGQKDHPLVGRFEGARLVLQRAYSFDEVRLIVAPIEPERAGRRSGPGFVTVEGKSSLYYYLLPAGRSPAEVIRSYAATFEKNGFQVVFQCSTQDTSCVVTDHVEQATPALAEGFINAQSAPRLNGDLVSSWFSKQGRYLLTQLERPDGPLIVAMAVGEGAQGGAVVVRIVEAKAFKPGVIEGLKKD